MSGGAPPRAERPEIGAGYLEPKRLPWRWARLRLERARNYWVVTVTGAGRPHARPVWGVWLDDTFHFSTGGRIGRHLDARPDVSVHLESGDETVIVEGRANPLADRAIHARVVAAYEPKYGWTLEAGQLAGFYSVAPRVVFGWCSDGSGEDAGAIYAASATRWRFEG